MNQLINITCPVCEVESNQPLIQYLNVAEHPEDKQYLQNGEFFNFECPNCGAQRQIQSTFVYHDPDKKLMIFLVPNLDERLNEIDDLLDKQVKQLDYDLSDYQLRLVSNSQELIEKIAIFDMNYDDQEVEVVKLLTDGLFAQEQPDLEIYGRYFSPSFDGAKIFYVTPDQQLMVDFKEDLLEFAKNKFGKQLSQDYTGHFVYVGRQWAMNILEKKPGDTPAE